MRSTGDTPLRNDGTPARSFGSAPADAARTPRRRPRRYPHTHYRRFPHTRGPCKRPPVGKSPRSRGRGECTPPSSSRRPLADTRSSSSRKHRHTCYRLRCTIDSAGGPLCCSLIDPRSTHRWLAYGISLHHLSIRASVICQSPADQLVGMSSRETPRGSSAAGSWLETLIIAANTVAPMPQTKPKSQSRNSVIASPLAIHLSNIHRTFSGGL